MCPCCSHFCTDAWVLSMLHLLLSITTQPPPLYFPFPPQANSLKQLSSISLLFFSIFLVFFSSLPGTRVSPLLCLHAAGGEYRSMLSRLALKQGPQASERLTAHDQQLMALGVWFSTVLVDFFASLECPSSWAWIPVPHPSSSCSWCWPHSHHAKPSFILFHFSSGRMFLSGFLLFAGTQPALHSPRVQGCRARRKYNFPK